MPEKDAPLNEDRPSSAGADPGSAPGAAGSKRGRRKRSDDKPDPSIVRKYYPVFENLIMFILDAKRWQQAFRAYFKEELGYRGRLLLRGFVFLICAAAFLFGTVGMFLTGSFLAFRSWTGNAAYAAFIMVAFGLLLSLAFLLLVSRSFRKLSEFKRYRKRRSIVRHEE